MNCHLTATSLTRESFAAFGEAIDFEAFAGAGSSAEAGGGDATFDPDRHEGEPPIPLAAADADDLPFVLWSLECRPTDARLVLPLMSSPLVFAVAPDVDGRPGDPLAFRTNGSQGIRFLPGVWHFLHVPDAASAAFCIIECQDRQSKLRILDRPRIIGVTADSGPQVA